RRLAQAVRVVRKACSIPISIDTSRCAAAEAGLSAGASIINDVTGLLRDPFLGGLARKARGLILMAHPRGSRKKLKGVIPATRSLLLSSFARATDAGVPAQKMALDPGIGFFRDTALPWWKWDLALIRGLNQLTSLPAPLLIGVSRKSFLG